MMFRKERDGVKEMNLMSDPESSEESLMDITKITLVSQISIWRMGEVRWVFTTKHLF